MKNIFLMVSVVVCVFLSSGCRTISPDVGHESVVVKKPLFFGHGGVEDESIKPGLVIASITTEAIEVNMQPQQYHVKFDDLMSADGVPLDFDAIIRLKVLDSVKLIKTFGEKWYENNVEREFSNRVRQAVRKHGMNETAIKTEAIDAIDREVSDAVQSYLTASQLPIQLIQVTVGKANPPDSIKNQRIETAAQQQRILTEQQKKLAEDSRKNAELSRAEADNAYKNAMQLSPEQYLRLETIKMQRDVCSSGKCTFILSDGKTQPIIDARK